MSIESNPCSLNKVICLPSLVKADDSVCPSTWGRDGWGCTRASERQWDFCWDLNQAVFSLDLRLGRSKYWRDCISAGTVMGVDSVLGLITIQALILLPWPMSMRQVYILTALMLGLALCLALANEMLADVKQAEAWNVLVQLGLLRRIIQGSCCLLSPTSRWIPSLHWGVKIS